MKNSIGGYFELEDLVEQGKEFHASSAYKLVNGRSALLYLFNQIKPKKVLLPFYTCDTLVQPLSELNINYSFYSINASFLPEETTIDNDAFYILINYFGLIESQLLKWTETNRVTNFIVDNTHSFFSKPESYISFNSARKFFGVTDGAYLFTNGIQMQRGLAATEFDWSFLGLRKEGKVLEGYGLYKKNESSQPCSLISMSLKTQQQLTKIDYKYALAKRQQNFAILDSGLKKLNTLRNAVKNEVVPFAYPFLPAKPIAKHILYSLGIFFPTLWQEVIDRPGSKYSWEKKLSAELIPLPLDHRYGDEEMKYIVNNIQTLLK